MPEGIRAPASVGQRLLWLMEHYRGSAGVLNCPLLVRFRGPLDVAAVKLVVDRLTGRHESLRTVFVGTGRRLAQVVQEPRPVTIECKDLSGEPDVDAALVRSIAAQLESQIDASACPVRVGLWRLGGDDHVLCFNMHHLVADGWSCGVIFEEISTLYEIVTGGRAALPGVGWQFAQFVQWQTEAFESAAFRVHQQYWRRQLDGMKIPALPFAGTRSDPTRRHVGRETVCLTPTVSAGLRQIARGRRSTIFSVMLSIYYWLLMELTGDRDLAVASVFANRLKPELRRTVGPLAHMVVLRTQLRRVATFGDLLRETHGAVSGAFLHQEVPFHMVPGFESNTASARADDVVFQMVARPLVRSTVNGTYIRALEVEGMGQRFGCECAVFPVEDSFTVAVSYDENRLDPVFVRALIARYGEAASRVAANPDVRLAALAN